ncbi:MAG: hypothetical protein K2N00_05500 [Lachnospiraceae bacterium]|nr:hypothetical protein [Lachnospiraceae bacterium]
MKETSKTLIFIIKCIAIPATAILLIFLLDIPYKKIDDAKYMDLWNLRMLGNQINEVKIANVGSSHGAYDFTYDELTEAGYSCFNFGNVSQTYQYDLALLKEYGMYLDEGGVLFIPVSYFSFNNETVNETEAQALSIKYYHCLSPKNIPDYDLYTDIVTTRLPVLSAGADLLKLLPDLNLALTVFAQEDGIDEAEFANRAAQRYDRHFNNKETYFLPERSDQLLSIIDYCNEHEITPVLITTPFSSYYNALVSNSFLYDFYSTIDRITSDTGVSYYDYSHDDRFNNNLSYFSDPDHLNEEGAHYFMEILEEEIPELQEVMSGSR